MMTGSNMVPSTWSDERHLDNGPRGPLIIVQQTPGDRRALLGQNPNVVVGEMSFCRSGGAYNQGRDRIRQTPLHLLGPSIFFPRISFISAFV